MSNTHTGNVQPQLDNEEHAHISNTPGKKVFIIDNADNQIIDFVNPTANITVEQGTIPWISSATVTQAGVINALATVIQGDSLPAGGNYIGLATVDIGTIPEVNSLATVTINSVPTVSAELLPRSFYQQESLASGYKWYGFATPGSNPTQALWRIQRETMDTGSFLFANGTASFVHTWSAASLASISYA